MAFWRFFLATLCLALLMTCGDTALQPGAAAQSCPATSISYVFRDGRTMSVFYCDTRWPGIGSEKIESGCCRVTEIDGKQPATEVRPPAIERSTVRFLCNGKCPSDLPSASAKEDTLLWKDGKRTVGRFEIRCERERCRIHQNGTPQGVEFMGWEYMPRDLIYIEFGSGAAHRREREERRSN
jgi:hypothetical protein